MVSFDHRDDGTAEAVWMAAGVGELPALPATLGLPGLLMDVLSGGGRLHGTRYLRQRIHGVPGALDLIGWSIGTWAHGRAYVAPLDGYTPAARDAAALADRDSLAALPTA